MNYHWTCPFCDQSGTTEWSKSAYYNLESHLLVHHQQEAANAILAMFDLKGFLITHPNIGWRFIGQYVSMPDEVKQAIQDEAKARLAKIK